MSTAPVPRYAVVETKDLVETHRLVDRARDAEVIVAPGRGGMVTRFRIGDDDILFLDQATLRDHGQNVRGGIPILFPIAGRLTGDQFLVDGQPMPMAQHGFARKMPWQIVPVDADAAAAIALVLESTDATLAVWPYQFRITFEYRLRDGALAIRQRFANLGERPMPMHPGLHPYFRVEDYRKSAARVVTAATRAFDNRLGALRALDGPLGLAGAEIDLQILDHGASTLRFQRPDARPLQLTFDSPRTVVTVWTQPGRDFVCVEPWSARSDALNRGDALVVAPGGAHETTFEIARQEGDGDGDDGA